MLKVYIWLVLLDSEAQKENNADGLSWVFVETTLSC